jgi:hypothetical protein
MALRRQAAWPSVLCGGAALVLYLFCLAPGVATGGDCGELISAAFHLGVAHPSGYALYCLSAKIFITIFPFGEVAYRANCFSALCGAGTVGVVAFLLSRFFLPSNSSPEIQTGSTPAQRHSADGIFAAATAALLLAGFIFFGAQSLIAEVYAPTGLAVALLFWCAASWNQTRRFSALCALALGLGLALNLHLSVIFLLPGLLIFFAWHLKSSRFGKAPAASTPKAKRAARRAIWQSFAPALLFLLGFGVTLYLPLRAATFPEPPREIIAGREYSWYQPLDWGHPVDFERWKAHVLVQQYKSLLWQTREIEIGGRKLQIKTFAQSPTEAFARLRDLLGFFALQFLWAAPLVLWGAIVSWHEKEKRPLAALLLATFASNIFIAIHYRVDNVFDIANFLFPSYIVLALWMGLGIAALLNFVRHCGSWSWRFSTLCKLAIIGAIITQWFVFVGAASWRGNTRARDDALERAAALEKLQKQTGRAPTLLSYSDDALFPFWYAQKVLGKAADVRTPFGPALHAYEEQNKLPQLTARFMKTGPVATTQWHAEISEKFPYAPLTRDGNLWQMTTGVLPPPATRIAPMENTLRARFLKTQIRRGELAGFQADFKYRSLQRQREFPTDKTQNAAQIGWLEILVAPRSLKLKPIPGQGELRLTAPHAALLVYKQRRKLVAPQNARDGESLRAIVPLEIPIEIAPGECDVWARMVAAPADGSTPWTKAAPVTLIVR